MKKSQSISAALVSVTLSYAQAGHLGGNHQVSGIKGTELETKVTHFPNFQFHLYDYARQIGLHTAIEPDSARVVLAYALLPTRQKPLR